MTSQWSPPVVEDRSVGEMRRAPRVRSDGREQAEERRGRLHHYILTNRHAGAMEPIWCARLARDSSPVRSYSVRLSGIVVVIHGKESLKLLSSSFVEHGRPSR